MSSVHETVAVIVPDLGGSASAAGVTAASTRNTQPLPVRPTSRGDLIGGGPAFRRALRITDRVPLSACTMLIMGEGSTGKELAVARLHAAIDLRQTVQCHENDLPRRALAPTLGNRDRAARLPDLSRAAAGEMRNLRAM